MKYKHNTTRKNSSTIKFNCTEINNSIKFVLVWSYFLSSFSFIDGVSIDKIDNKEELIKHLWDIEVFETGDEDVAKIMLDVDRKDFCPMRPYKDRPEAIGYHATISAPHMHAYALKSLRDYLKPGAKVLDVGAGSGYLSACMAVMIGKNGIVIGIDHIPEIVKLATENVKKNHKKLLKSGLLKFVTGDGRKGYSKEAPYDVIHVGAASEKIPEHLVEQLKPGGRMLVPIGSSHSSQQFIQIDKNKASEDLFLTTLHEVMYVPLLVDKDIQLKSEI